jgi:membrane fusion protein (multidrug efflux system)
VDLPLDFDFVAQVRSSHQVEIISRVSGFLEQIAYKEGKPVRLGDVLFRLDNKQFQAKLTSAQAEVASREADLATAQANLRRIASLNTQGVVSGSELDTAVGRERMARAALAQAGAGVEQARLDLGYTTITSPIAGIAGRAQAREGMFLAAGSPEAKLTQVLQVDPVWVEFSVTQNQYQQMRRAEAQGRIVAPEASDFEVDIVLPDGERHPHSGRFSFVAPSFDQQTGAFQIRADVPNPEHTLAPGMFVRAVIRGAVRPGAIVVPQRAVQQTSNGHMVYVANDKDQAEARPVAVGPWSGQDWIIEQGLTAGDRLITDGFQRLAPGAPIRVAANATAPAGAQ